MPHFMRAILDRAGGEIPERGPLRFVASTEEPGRDGLVIKQDGWRLDAYRANPVVLWAHDYASPPIGRAEVRVEGKQLLAEITFDPDDEFARTVERKYRAGFLSAVSVGWETRKIEPPANSGDHARVIEAELLDISAVPVPGDPKALIERHRRALAGIGRELAALLDPAPSAVSPDGRRGAIPPHTTPKAPEDTPWDGPGEVAKAPSEAAVLRRMHAWVDAEADPDTKRAYKLPHHLVSGEVVWRGVAAAMARLLQAGTEIPEADRRGVYRHLAAHYEQFGRTPPEFRAAEELAALGPDEMRGLFLEGEPELVPEEFAWLAQRAGAVLSARNRERIEQAVALLREVLSSAQAKPEDSAPTDDEERAIALLAQLRDHLGAITV